MTTDAIAVREPSGALAIQPGQTAFDKVQLAALRQLGIEDASEGDQAVFLHVSQRTGLDPFSKQIYMIGRREKVPGTQNDWRTKYTIQTGIEGFRTLRSRAERDEGIRGILSRPVYYDAEGKEYKVWFQRTPPVAVEMTYTVRDRSGTETPYVSILRYVEYAQFNGSGDLTGQWKTKGVHMLEKCAEADVYRKAFPQDFSGVTLDDAMPLADAATGGQSSAQPAPRGVTAQQARQRAAQTVTATVVAVTPQTAPPAQPHPPSADSAPPVADAGGAPRPPQLATSGQVGMIQKELERLGLDDRDAKIRVVSRIAGRPMESSKFLTADEARKVRDTLQGLADGNALAALLDEIALADIALAEDELEGEAGE